MPSQFPQDGPRRTLTARSDAGLCKRLCAPDRSCRPARACADRLRAGRISIDRPVVRALPRRVACIRRDALSPRFVHLRYPASGAARAVVRVERQQREQGDEADRREEDPGAGLASGCGGWNTLTRYRSRPWARSCGGYCVSSPCRLREFGGGGPATAPAD